MAISFEKRDMNLVFGDRNKNSFPVTSTINATMTNESGVEMTDETGDAMDMVVDFQVKTLRLTFAKRDTNLIFGERQL